MKKITKKESNKFIKTCTDILEMSNATKVETSEFYYKSTHYILENEAIGKLAIKIDDDNTYCYSIFSKFENEKLAFEYFNCNSHSGKYNLHTSYPDEPIFWLKKLLYQFESIEKVKELAV